MRISWLGWKSIFNLNIKQAPLISGPPALPIPVLRWR